MGSYISFHSENHNFSNTSKLIREQGVISKGIKIGNNVWIGGNVVINPGITIGDNSVIGSGSIVTKNIPSNVIAVGNPCKIIREINENVKLYFYKNHKFEPNQVVLAVGETPSIENVNFKFDVIKKNT